MKIQKWYSLIAFRRQKKRKNSAPGHPPQVRRLIVRVDFRLATTIDRLVRISAGLPAFLGFLVVIPFDALLGPIIQL